jgi:large subunit ribosomal protein L15
MMSLENLSPANGSTHSKKRVGRGQGSGNGKTAGKGHKGQRARSGYKEKRGFEGGQQPLQRRLPKIGFTSKIVKPEAVNVEKYAQIKDMKEITVAALIEAGIVKNNATKVKLIGASAKDLAGNIKDENITTSGK